MFHCIFRFLRPLGIVLLLLVAQPAYTYNKPFNDIIAFGDSLTDVGNVAGLTLPGFSPVINGYYQETHFSDNIIWVEFLAKYWGLSARTPGRTNSTTLPPSPKGNTWAWGGSEAASGMVQQQGVTEPIPNLLSEINEYLLSNSVNPMTLYTDNPVNFDSKKVYLLDQESNVYLFRGNLPLMDGYFDYSDLTNRVRQILAEQQIDLPGDYQLIDLSLLNKRYHSVETAVEKDWFAANPKMGSFRLHPLYGCSTNPLSVPALMRYYMTKYYDFDGLNSFMIELRKLMEQVSERDIVIYMHCDEGKDRVGEAAACYLMQYKGYTYLDALVQNFRIARRHVQKPQYNAVRWYAFYLRDVLGMTTIGPIEGQ